MAQYTYRKRAFLNPPSTGLTSHVYAEAESSENGEYKLGNYLLTIADCKRRIDLEFYLGTPRHRRQSIRKAELLAQTLTDFAKAVKAEAALIDAFEKRKD